MTEVVSFPKGGEFRQTTPDRTPHKRTWFPSLGCYVLRLSYEPASVCGILEIEGDTLNIRSAFDLFGKLDPKVCWLDVYGDNDGEPVCETYYSAGGDAWWKTGS